MIARFREFGLPHGHVHQSFVHLMRFLIVPFFFQLLKRVALLVLLVAAVTLRTKEKLLLAEYP